MRTFPHFTRSTPRSTLSGAFAWVEEGAFYGEGEIFHGQFSSGEIIFEGKCLGRAYLQGNHLEGNYPGGGVVLPGGICSRTISRSLLKREATTV